jgi:hypothetical protein
MRQKLDAQDEPRSVPERMEQFYRSDHTTPNPQSAEAAENLELMADVQDQWRRLPVVRRMRHWIVEILPLSRPLTVRCEV